MTTRNNDPLLLAGKVATIFMQIAMGIGAAVLVLLILASPMIKDELIAEYAQKVGDPSATFHIWLMLGVLLIGLAIVAAMFVFFGKLRAIIGTVGEGDPFQPANADRLSMMGWLILGVQLLILPATALALQLARFANEIDGVNLTVDGGFDLSAILLTIILFILARVFRHGAAMREDLEGTV